MSKRILYLSMAVIAVVVFAFAGCGMFGNDGDDTNELPFRIYNEIIALTILEEGSTKEQNKVVSIPKAISGVDYSDELARIDSVKVVFPNGEEKALEKQSDGNFVYFSSGFPLPGDYTYKLVIDGNNYQYTDSTYTGQTLEEFTNVSVTPDVSNDAITIGFDNLENLPSDDRYIVEVYNDSDEQIASKSLYDSTQAIINNPNLSNGDSFYIKCIAWYDLEDADWGKTVAGSIYTSNKLIWQ